MVRAVRARIRRRRSPAQTSCSTSAALLRRPSSAADQQVHDRCGVAQVGLEPTRTLLRPNGLHVRRVELDDVMAGCDQPGHDRAVVVTGGLDPDPDRHRRPLLPGLLQMPLERTRADLGQRERQRQSDDLTAVIGDQAQALVLADIDARRQTSRRVQPPRLLHVLQLLRPTDELHDNPLNDNDPGLTDSEAGVRRA